MKEKIALIKLGHVEHLANFQKLKKWNSKLFEISVIQCIDYLPESDVEDGYLDQKYTKNGLNSYVSCPNGCDLAVAVMPYRFHDNFYMHRLNTNCVVISLYEISQILEKDHISMENFIVKQIYEICALKKIVNNISTDEVYSYVHLDTRGCLFDMNGERSDILYNTEQPKICDSCREAFRKKQIDANVLSTLEKELKRIKKPYILTLEKQIKKYPFISIVLSALIAIFLNLIANLIFELIK